MEENEEYWKRTESKNKRIAWIFSILVQIFLLLSFYFLTAWKEPVPSIPEYGIELGFQTLAGSSEQTPNEENVEEVEEEQELKNLEELEESTEEDNSSLPPLQNDNPVKENPNSDDITNQTSDISQSIEKLEDPKEEEEENEKEEVKKDKIDAKKSKNNPKKDADQQKQLVDQRSLYKENTNSKDKGNNSEDGASLSISGWIWDFRPVPEDKSEESGKIIYKVMVDEEGYLLSIQIVTSSVSPALERKYREAVEKLTFSKTSEYESAIQSTGTITFIIKAK